MPTPVNAAIMLRVRASDQENTNYKTFNHSCTEKEGTTTTIGSLEAVVEENVGR
jgi:hypothetical protein